MRKRHRIGSNAAWITLGANLILATVKAVVGVLSGSLVVLSDAAHSGSDALSTILVLLGLHVSRQPPDEKHPYGHSRAETVVAKVIALILVLIGINFAFSAVKAILARDFHTPKISAFWVSLLSIAVKEAMYQYSYRIGRKIDSPALIADAWHHRSDALSSVAALAGVFLARLGYPVFDPLMAIVVAIILIKVGWDMVFTVIDELMNAQVEPEILDKIKAIVLSVPKVSSLRNLKVHKYGAEHHVNCTITVPAKMNVSAGHDLCHLVREKIRREYPTVTQVDIHLEPDQDPKFES
ncbi:MAG: cation transporter [Firmicutes bacterium]|nr:cation transporter [Bacillota bacterium]